MNFIAIDFETANNFRSSICSMGVAIVENGKLVGSEHFLIKPTPNHYDSFNSLLHGIEDKHTRDKKTFKQQWKGLQKYFNNQTIVAHNASFDCSVLRFTLDSSKLRYPDLDYHCTYRLSQELLPLGSFRLDNVSRHFKIRLKHHNAESDAKASALIALRLCEKHNANTLEELSTTIGFKVGKIFSETNSYRPFSKR
ncbi:MAG: 3'-5' exonuclease [Flavobacteriales bacterium]|nr:3'-5' exonuclease [Flavobacteriales bacterium]